MLRPFGLRLTTSKDATFYFISINLNCVFLYITDRLIDTRHTNFIFSVHYNSRVTVYPCNSLTILSVRQSPFHPFSPCLFISLAFWNTRSPGSNIVTYRSTDLNDKNDALISNIFTLRDCRHKSHIPLHAP